MLSLIERLTYYRKKFDPSSAPGWRVPFRAFSVSSPDGVRIEGTKLEGGPLTDFLVVPGLLAHHHAPGIKEFCESLTRFGTVFAIDLRGHGSSSGTCTLGNKEALDVAATMDLIGRPPVVIGFSMGAAAAVRASGLLREASAVVSISGPARWHGHRRWAAHRTALMWRLPGGTKMVRLLTGTRLDPDWVASEEPAQVAGKIAPAPLLVVHGTADDFFHPREAEDLHEMASEPKAIWIIEGSGHAEGLFSRPARTISTDAVDEFVDNLIGRIPWPN